MKKITVIVVVLLVISCFGLTQNKAQDVDRHDHNQAIVQRQGQEMPVYNWDWPKATNLKHPLWYRQADKDDILGMWEFVDIPNSTIEFKSDGFEHTFQFYDDALESWSGGKWSGSYYDNILIVTLFHSEIDVTEKLAVRGINRKTLALGSIENGEFVYRYRIKKQ